MTLLADWQLREQKRLSSKMDSAFKQRLLEQNDWILGEELRKFEKEFCSFLGVPYGFGTSSGSDSLFLALRTLGVGFGDEVILPAFTYVATGQAVLRTGAVPVFADIEPDRWTISSTSVLKVKTTRTKAVLPVHPFGRATDMLKISAICRDHGLFLVEDACDGFGSLFNEQFVGGFGDIGCFSFHPGKVLSAYGDGGFICTKNRDLANRLECIRDPGDNCQDEQTFLRYNHRLDTFQAAILRIKLKEISRSLSRRRAIAREITQSLSDLELTHGFLLEDAPTALILLTSHRQKFRRYLLKENFKCRFPYSTILPDLPLFKEYLTNEEDWPVSRFAAKNLVAIPIHPEMSDQECAFLIKIVRKFYHSSIA